MPSLVKERILFIDIETVSQTQRYQDLPERFIPLWEHKAETLRQRMPAVYHPDMDDQTIFEKGAGIFAEFGKVICISVGFIFHKDGEERFRVKSFYGDDEKKLLIDFVSTLNAFGSSGDFQLCGHNIKEFDVPYLCRRLLIQGLPLPEQLNFGSKKPWEVPLLDTLEMWKFGDFKHYTSLNLLTALFDIPTPKDDIDGSQVTSVYYTEHNVKRIATYCEKDVVATAQLFLRLNQWPVIAPECIEHIE